MGTVSDILVLRCYCIGNSFSSHVPSQCSIGSCAIHTSHKHGHAQCTFSVQLLWLLRTDGNLSKWQENDYFLNEASREQSKQRRTRTWLLALTIATGILAVIAMTAVALAASTQRLQDQLLKQQQLVGGILAGGTQTNQGWQGIKKIAFGSCTAYDLRPQPIWTQGVIPAQPDAWVWLGDFAYMDDPLMDCHIVPDFPEVGHVTP